MAKEKREISGGIGFMGVLAIVFITLKLTNNIDWSWFWVTAPIWGVFGLLLAGGLLACLLVLAMRACNYIMGKK